MTILIFVGVELLTAAMAKSMKAESTETFSAALPVAIASALFMMTHGTRERHAKNMTIVRVGERNGTRRRKMKQVSRRFRDLPRSVLEAAVAGISKRMMVVTT
jgi:uncharacterized protein (DUF2267 family)